VKSLRQQATCVKADAFENRDAQTTSSLAMLLITVSKRKEVDSTPLGSNEMNIPTEVSNSKIKFAPPAEVAFETIVNY